MPNLEDDSISLWRIPARTVTPQEPSMSPILNPISLSRDLPI